MPRRAESSADSRLRAALADQGLLVSRYQLERWRQLGLMPRPKVVRVGFGGSRVEEHSAEVFTVAEILARESRRGRPWQQVALRIFESGLPLSESCLRECCRHVVDGVQARLRSYWDEAAAMVPITSDDADDNAHVIAERAVLIMRERRAMRPLVGLIRRSIDGLLPNGNRRERQQALHAALVYRMLDIARPGSLTEEERYLAITGQESGEVAGVTPIAPSDIAVVARTLTLREAHAMRDWLTAAWETGEFQVNPEAGLLEHVLIEIAALRLAEDSQPLDQPLPYWIIKEMNQRTVQLLSDLDDGFVPGQLSLDDVEGNEDDLS